MVHSWLVAICLSVRRADVHLVGCTVLAFVHRSLHPYALELGAFHEIAISTRLEREYLRDASLSTLSYV